MSPISQIARISGYTRSHIHKMLMAEKRKKKGTVGLRKVGARWVGTDKQIEEFAELVTKTSGRRYKLGETGPRS